MICRSNSISLAKRWYIRIIDGQRPSTFSDEEFGAPWWIFYNTIWRIYQNERRKVETFPSKKSAIFNKFYSYWPFATVVCSCADKKAQDWVSILKSRIKIIWYDNLTLIGLEINQKYRSKAETRNEGYSIVRTTRMGLRLKNKPVIMMIIVMIVAWIYFNLNSSALNMMLILLPVELSTIYNYLS